VGRFQESTQARAVALMAVVALLSGCASGVTQRWRPIDMVQAPRAGSVALLSALHPSDSLKAHADSVFPVLLAAACPGVTIMDARATESRFAERGVVVPRRLSSAFAAQARTALDADLLLSPTVLGVLADSRSTVAGILADDQGDQTDESAGVSIEGWDLRNGQRAVQVTRIRASSNSWTNEPLNLFKGAARDAINVFSAVCRADVNRTAPGRVDAARTRW
jgi:hypothetical protein